MSYYKKLNLPANPFKDWDAVYADETELNSWDKIVERFAPVIKGQ